tara:strand:- start:2593 stop:3282 length:690 start_codon:yes stop_codon:yes gene_type:complete
MADVNVNYDYRVPNELWIDDFSENLTRTFNYVGPEELIVTLPPDGSGYTQKLDGPVYPGETQVTINVTTNPELLPHADLLWDRPDDHVVQFTTTNLDDGANTVYQEYSNPTIHDYYWKPIYNMETNSWPTELQLITKDTMSPVQRTFVAKADMFVEILDQFTLSSDDATLFANFKTALDTYKSRIIKPWKYVGENPFDLTAPSIPMSLIDAVNKVKGGSFEKMFNADDL